MIQILTPASSPEDWKKFLSDPEKHWKTGYSAKAMAYCWHESGSWPPEIASTLDQIPSLKGLKPIFAIPEHKVPLPGGKAASQNDVWVLGETAGSLVSIAVEGKVSESFSQTIEQWFKKKTPGKETRLKFLCSELGLDYPTPSEVRYQLLHRTVSAILDAYSGACRPVIPKHPGHLFRSMAATQSGASRPPIPEKSGHNVAL